MRRAQAIAPRIGLAVETSGGTGRDMLHGIAAYVRSTNWRVHYRPGSLGEATAWLIESARSQRFDGIIARFDDERSAHRIARMRVPVVDMLGEIDVGVPVVHVDDRAIARLAADHLLERGFRSLAYVGNDPRRFGWAARRGAGFLDRVRKHAHSVVEFRWRSRRLPRPQEAELRRLAHWIAGVPKPVGIFVCSDLLGRRVLDACRRVSVAVPDEAAVVGVDNDVVLCDLSVPPLSSVDGNYVSVGFEAATLLGRLLSGGRAPAGPVLLPPLGLVARASSDRWAVPDPDVAHALRFIHERANSALGVGDVVAQVPLSRRVLERRFHALLGRSIYEEILSARIQRVQQLLTGTELSIKAIAAETGFDHAEHLSALFRSKVGQSPRVFRNAARTRRER